MIQIKQRKPVILLSAAGLIIIVLLIIFAGRGDSIDLPSTQVQFGKFKIELTATGEIQATQSINISAPRTRSNLQIVKLVSEGTLVDSGDFLIQFDTDELQKKIDAAQSELEIVQANMQKSDASMDANMAQLVSSLENTQASYELAQLRLEQMAFEADVKVLEEKLRLRQSEISLEQSRTKIESQKTMDAAEKTTLNLKIQQAEAELRKAKQELGQLTMNAPAPGLVVYNKIWKGSNMEKIKVGDTPWRGQALIQLPDLSNMQVETEISEADIGKLEVGQTATIKLDAFPDPTFTGAIDDIASLAHEKEREEDIKVFDVVIKINETDKILKPGMTAKVKILIEAFDDKFYVPIEAVFEKDEAHVIYSIGGKHTAIEVIPGKRNENFVTIEGDVKQGILISLVDPSRPIEIEGSSKSNGSPSMPANGGKDKSETTTVTVREK